MVEVFPLKNIRKDCWLTGTFYILFENKTTQFSMKQLQIIKMLWGIFKNSSELYVKYNPFLCKDIGKPEHKKQTCLKQLLLHRMPLPKLVFDKADVTVAITHNWCYCSHPRF